MPGRPDNQRIVCSRKLSYRVRQPEPIVSDRSISSGSKPDPRNRAAAASPAGPAPTMTT
jgi:hypothetical protein